MTQGRSFKMRSQIGPKTEQDSLLIANKPISFYNTLNENHIFDFFGPPGERSGLAFARSLAWPGTAHDPSGKFSVESVRNAPDTMT
jgi:hypothetical protein